MRDLTPSQRQTIHQARCLYRTLRFAASLEGAFAEAAGMLRRPVHGVTPVRILVDERRESFDKDAVTPPYRVRARFQLAAEDGIDEEDRAAWESGYRRLLVIDAGGERHMRHGRQEGW